MKHDKRKKLLEKQNEEMLKLLGHCTTWTEEQLDTCNIGIRKILIDNGVIALNSFPPPPKDPPGGTNP